MCVVNLSVNSLLTQQTYGTVTRGTATEQRKTSIPKEPASCFPVSKKDSNPLLFDLCIAADLFVVKIHARVLITRHGK